MAGNLDVIRTFTLSTQEHFIFGYGSLICAESRARTGVSGEAVDATVQGIERGWIVPVSHSQQTALGAMDNDQARCNGVVFAIDEDNLAKFDERELGYTRRLVPHDKIDSRQKLPENAKVWTYVGVESRPPNEHFPITQSYLDVIVNGCLSFGGHFLQNFVKTTSHWGHLINDRHEPRYPRPMAGNAHHRHFDEWLAELIPHHFERRS